MKIKINQGIVMILLTIVFGIITFQIESNQFSSGFLTGLYLMLGVIHLNRVTIIETQKWFKKKKKKKRKKVPPYVKEYYQKYILPFAVEEAMKEVIKDELKKKNKTFITAIDPKIKKRVPFLVMGNKAISLVSGYIAKYKKK